VGLRWRLALLMVRTIRSILATVLGIGNLAWCGGWAR
jgi:hypothetical protein